jgi:small subunit ribosomal protein S18
MLRTDFKDSELNLDDIATTNYKDTKFLSNFISDQGKILPRRTTGLSSKQQKRITKLIKRARIAALLPFVIGKG